jgi:hypothetical protein
VLFHLELEQPRLRIDGLDRAHRDHSAAAQDAGAQDERGRLAARGVDHDVLDNSDARPTGQHREALGSHEPVLEHVAAPAEHVRPHTGCVRIGAEYETSGAEDGERRGPRDRFGPRGRLELPQDGAHVVVHRALREDETLCDLGVAQPLRQ